MKNNVYLYVARVWGKKVLRRNLTIRKEEKQELLNDIEKVGPQKPLGYLPLDCLRLLKPLRICIKEAKARGLAYKVFPATESDIGSFYVWDVESLQALLNHHKKVLRRAHIPIGVDKFVDYIYDHTVVNKAAYRVVGLAFADKRFK